MSLDAAIMMTARLVSFTLFIQGIEMLFITRKTAFLKIWSYENLKNDLQAGLPLPRRLVAFIFNESIFKAVISLQILVSAFGIFYANPLFFVALFITNLLICIRFRGTFNGGSDMMTFVLLTGILISLFGSSYEAIRKLGMIYITIHTVYSYFKAGLAKMGSSDWSRGRALPAFLGRSLFSDTQAFGQGLGKRNFLSTLLGLGVLAFELSAILLLIFPKLSVIYFIAVAFFHFVIYLGFGLNRFFWVWMTAWPAVLFTFSLFGS